MNVDSSRLFILCPPFVHKDPTFCTPLSTGVGTGNFSRYGTGSALWTLPVDGNSRLEESALGPLFDTRGELLHLVVDLATLGHLLANLLVRVHDCGVVATEGLPDLR